MSPVFASLGMKLAQNGSSKEWAVKVSFVQFLAWKDSEFSPLKTNEIAYNSEQSLIDIDTENSWCNIDTENTWCR